MANFHLAILKKRYLDAILDGSKTVESRLTLNRCEPFGRIDAGDTVFLKVTSGAVLARAKVKTVKQFENLTPDEIMNLKNEYNHLICGPDEYWQEKLQSKYAVLIWLENVKPIAPLRIEKKDWRAWAILKPEKHFGLLS